MRKSYLKDLFESLLNSEEEVPEKEISGTGTILDSPTMISDIDDVYGDKPSGPAYDYDAKEDPEITGRWNIKESTRLFERWDTNEFVKNFLRNNPSSKAEDIYDGFPEEEKRKTTKEDWINRINNSLKRLGVSYEEKSEEYNSDVEESERTYTYDDLESKNARELAKMSRPKTTISSYAKSADNKYKEIYDNTTSVLCDPACDPRHLFIYGDGGVGKSYSVNQAIKIEFPKGDLCADGWVVKKARGGIGTALGPLTAFFFRYNENHILVFDDCDGFITSPDKEVQNLLKQTTDTDNKVDDPISIMSPTSIVKNVNRYLKSLKKEGVIMSIDKKALRENNILKLSVNGKLVAEEKMSNSNKEKFIESIRETSSLKKLHEESHKKPSNWDYFHFELFNESEDYEEDDYEDEDIDDLEEDEFTIPWLFTSRVILVSNLKTKDITQAVATRFLKTELSLTPEEYLARLAEILPNLNSVPNTRKNVRGEIIDQSERSEFRELAKKAALASLDGVIELWRKRIPFAGHRIHIIKENLQFRLISTLTNKWELRMKRQAAEKGLDVYSLSEDEINDLFNEIKFDYIDEIVIPQLEEPIKK